MTSSLEYLFNASTLSVIVPDTSLEYPPSADTDVWLDTLKSSTIERKQAFFDEHLQSFVVVEIEHPAADEPPPSLLSFLAHLQVSLEATYISSVPTVPETPPSAPSAFLSAPPQRSGAGGGGGSRHKSHPSILPPSTPNPTPHAAETDRRYLRSEGTLLLAQIWGQDSPEDSKEAFSLLWSEKSKTWVAVYRLAVTVAFLRLPVSDPLLCLTVSATLREKPIHVTQKNPLSTFLAAAGSIPTQTEPSSPTDDAPALPEDEGAVLDGFEEVNLLDGLLGGPTFALDVDSPITLPSSRLGTVSRQKLFSLPPIIPLTALAPTPSPMTALRQAHPTLRKSYRKTLFTVSGFRVRMRTVFVPSVLLEDLADDVDEEDEEEQRDRREAGTEERTVVLCVEVENSGESGTNVGFIIDKIDVSVSGEGARTSLIEWRTGPRRKKENTFPLTIAAREQFNLLYAVTFLRSPEEVEGLMGFSAQGGQKGDKDVDPELSLQRAVAINIFGRPCVKPQKGSEGTTSLYPTETYSSKWNCVLDLSTPQQRTPHAQQGPRRHDSLDPGSFHDPFARDREIQPEPPSPFPVTITSPRSNRFSGSTQRRSSLALLKSPTSSGTGTPALFSGGSAGSKRHTMPSAGLVASRLMKSANPLLSGGGLSNRASTSVINYRSSSTYLPPSISIQTQLPPKSPTTYDAPYGLNGEMDNHVGMPPMTPAYPAFPSSRHDGVPDSPMAQPPLSHVMKNYISNAVEISRDRGGNNNSFGGGPGGYGAVPPTPAPVVGLGLASAATGTLDGTFERFQNQMQQQRIGIEMGTEGGIRFGIQNNSGGQGQNNGNGYGEDGSINEIVVSIGVLPLAQESQGKIRPLTYFTLDIFVFNRSERTRRFEVSCPDVRRKARKVLRETLGSSGPPGASALTLIGGVGAGLRKVLATNSYKYEPSPGVLPLDNRVRIGPLLPTACQSVRMEFLAITPGVHAIDTLTLTDVESGTSMNLRSVMDIVVHEQWG